MLEPLVVKATRAVPRREGRSNPPDLSNEVKEVIPCPYQILGGFFRDVSEYLLSKIFICGFLIII